MPKSCYLLLMTHCNCKCSSIYWFTFLSTHNDQGRRMLPLNMKTDDGPIYVNAKQYHGIIRRRQSRAKTVMENKLARARKVWYLDFYLKLLHFLFMGNIHVIWSMWRLKVLIGLVGPDLFFSPSMAFLHVLHCLLFWCSMKSRLIEVFVALGQKWQVLTISAIKLSSSLWAENQIYFDNL